MTCICIDGILKERNGHSASCNRSNRKAEMEALKPSKKPVKIKKVSEMQKARNELYSLLRKAYLLKHPVCEVNTKGCTKKAIEVHHRAGRGAKTNSVETFLAVCRNCHAEVELNPNWAKENKFSLNRL